MGTLAMGMHMDIWGEWVKEEGVSKDIRYELKRG
jgi:hypothetical protein